MSNVLLATDNTELAHRVHAAAGGTCIAVPAASLPSEPSALLSRSQHATLPDIVVLDATVAAEDALALAANFDADLPGTGVVLVGNPERLSVAAMRAGVRDVLPPDASADAFRDTFLHIGKIVEARRRPMAGHTLPQAPAMREPGRVVTVLSPKGGAGKTTLATNLAVGLAEAAPGTVVLVDLDVQFGDVATALGIEPDFTLDDIVNGAALRDPIALKTQLTLHESGLLTVCAPESPVAADAVTTEQVAALLEMLSSQFRFVVIDTAAGLEARTLAALDHTTDPVILTTFDVPGARGLRKEIITLRELGMLPNSRRIVLNFADSQAGLTVADVEATIQTSVDLTIPHSKAATMALNTGQPLLRQRPRDPVSKQVRKLLGQLSAVDERRAPGRHRVMS